MGACPTVVVGPWRGGQRVFSQHPPTHRSRAGTPLSPPHRSSIGFGLGCPPCPLPRVLVGAGGCWPHLRGCRGDQQVPPQQRQHLFIVAPGPPPLPSSTARLLLASTARHEIRGFNLAPASQRGLVSPLPALAVPWGSSGVRGGGTGQAARRRHHPRGHGSHNAALCPWYHRRHEAEAGKQGAAGWRDVVPGWRCRGRPHRGHRGCRWHCRSGEMLPGSRCPSRRHSCIG